MPIPLPVLRREGKKWDAPCLPPAALFRYAPGVAHPRQKTNRHASIPLAHLRRPQPRRGGQAVRLSGWCHRIRDHGGVLFIDLRDHYGMTQCVVDPDSPAFAAAEKLRSEYVVRFDGLVRKRPAGTENPEMPTGADRGLRAARSRCSARRAICRCRCSATSPIPRTRGCDTASSICAARSCTTTSCCAARSSTRCASA